MRYLLPFLAIPFLSGCGIAKRLMFFALALMITSGCATHKDINQFERDIKVKHAEMVRHGKDGQGLKPFSAVPGNYIETHRISLESGHSALPGKTLTFKESGVYLADIGDKISRATGIQVRFAPDLAKRKDIVNSTMNLRHSGELSELLNLVASFYNIHWEYVRGSNEILFFYQKTKSYTLTAFLADMNVQTSLTNKADTSGNAASSGGSTTGGSSGTNEQTVQTRARTEPWTEIVQNISRMISRDGSVVAAKAAGTVTVTDSPVVLARIDEYMRTLNNKLSRQIAINISIWNYRMEDESKVSAGINGIFDDGITKVLFGNTPGQMVSTSGSFVAGVLTGANSRWTGSTGVLEAMKEKGRATLATTISGITMNNQPLPLLDLKRTSYLASASTTMNSENAETSLIPGQIVSGLSALVTPHIQPNDIIDLDYDMTYSVIDDIQTIEAGNSKIQVPEVSSRSMKQRFQVRTGSTVVISGYASEKNMDNSGFGILNGLFKTKKEREYIVIFIDVSEMSIPTGDI